MTPQEHPPTSSYHANGRLVVRINRNYNTPNTTQFVTVPPPELEGKIGALILKDTVGTINAILRDAGKVSARTIFGNLVSCLTCYTVDLCTSSKMELAMQRISTFVETENQAHYMPAGLEILDPRSTGLLHLDIVVR
ncbi:Golgin subfamily A member 7/ERF4 [Powellomyces hirtus]|nr:Golgin subfamily A member 7/ERF4 [Powellomyces hirtus]